MEAIKNIPTQTTSFSPRSVVKNEPKFVCFRISQRKIQKYEAGQRKDYKEIVAENYLSARTQLLRISEHNRHLPDMIIIDLPYSGRDVRSFVDWLNKTPEFARIPVIYNKVYLDAFELKEISYSNMVDDIVEVEKCFELLPAKAVFLKKVKENISENNSVPALELPTAKSTAIKIDYLFRRMMDIIISSTLIILLLPIFVLITLLVFCESRGPVFYISHRAGRGYKIFKFLKFRTMYVGADNKRAELEKLNLYKVESSAPQFFKIKDDPRVTKIGAFLRNTSLDELPQLFNVIKGDMSIVGNRPLPLYEAATLTTDEWAERFMAPAGITGLWQIMKRGKEDMSVEERIGLDISYAKNNHLMKDLWILAKTPTALFQKTNV